MSEFLHNFELNKPKSGDNPTTLDGIIKDDVKNALDERYSLEHTALASVASPASGMEIGASHKPGQMGVMFRGDATAISGAGNGAIGISDDLKTFYIKKSTGWSSNSIAKPRFYRRFSYFSDIGNIGSVQQAYTFFDFTIPASCFPMYMAIRFRSFLFREGSTDMSNTITSIGASLAFSSVLTPSVSAVAGTHYILTSGSEKQNCIFGCSTPVYVDGSGGRYFSCLFVLNSGIFSGYYPIKGRNIIEVFEA